SHVLKLNASRSSWGVTTSGFGGRSLSRGIASAVTVVADQASVADAAATAIANACTVEDMAIVRVPAEQIDPNTDLPGVEVTVEIGPLSPEKKRKAMDRAFQKAEALVRKKVIIGALIALDDQVMITDKMSALMITGNVESIARKQQRQKEEEK
ncbi:MAG: hypothetical protein U9Q05_02690, partial [Thermodesulfobacteriota bacterium]|nr:hypothetical protein [Thermodesulfobacteriota bacterium]